MPRRLLYRQVLVLAGLLIALPSESIAKQRGSGHHGAGWRGGGHGGSHGHYRGYQRGYDGGYVGRYRYGRTVYSGYRGYGGYLPYGGYGGYRGYYGYGGYYGHHHDNDGVWIALGAGVLGFVLGSAIAPRPVYYYGYPSQPPYYGYPSQPAPPPAPAMQQCPDGSTIPAESYCPEPPPAAPQPPMGERG